MLLCSTFCTTSAFRNKKLKLPWLLFCKNIIYIIRPITVSLQPTSGPKGTHCSPQYHRNMGITEPSKVIRRKTAKARRRPHLKVKFVEVILGSGSTLLPYIWLMDILRTKTIYCNSSLLMLSELAALHNTKFPLNMHLRSKRVIVQIF